MALLTSPALAQRFDHEAHAEQVPRCTRCHEMNARNGFTPRRPMGHRACDGAGCHQLDELPTRRTLPPLCAQCHVGPRTFIFPPHLRRGESAFTLARFDHGDHHRAGNRGCVQCHAPRAAGASAETDFGVVGHETCGQSICHGGRVEPQMPDCAGCHVPGRGEALASATPDLYRTDVTFDHAGHAARAGEAPCAACHVETAAAAGAVVPLPPMAACGTCHDGTDAFSVTGTGCARCHVRPEAADVR